MSSGRRHGPSRSTMLVTVTSPIARPRMRPLLAVLLVSHTVALRHGRPWRGPVCDGAGGNVARGRTFYRQAWRLGHDQDAARLGGDRARRRRPPEQRRLHPGRVASAPDDQARADQGRAAGAEAELIAALPPPAVPRWVCGAVACG